MIDPTKINEKTAQNKPEAALINPDFSGKK